MRVAVIGSRKVKSLNLKEYIPKGTTEIVSGGAKGVDTFAREYAIKNDIKLTEFLPQYDNFSKNAPLMRNVEIIQYSELVLAFWDGKSKGTKFVIDKCNALGIKVEVFIIDERFL